MPKRIIFYYQTFISLEDEYHTFTISVTFISKSLVLRKLYDWDTPILALLTLVYVPEPVYHTAPPTLLLPEYDPVVNGTNPDVGHEYDPE